MNSSLFDSMFWMNLPLGEETFSQMKIELRCQSRLADERIKYCLHLCLSNYEPSFSKLSLDMQCHASPSQW